MPTPQPSPAPSDSSADPASPSPSASASSPPMQTRLMVEGSTGGAGLRGLQGDKPTPLELSVLYFDENHTLKAYDDIQLGGTGQSNVEMQRNVIGDGLDNTPIPITPTSSSPSPAPSPSR